MPILWKVSGTVPFSSIISNDYSEKIDRWKQEVFSTHSLGALTYETCKMHNEYALVSAGYFVIINQSIFIDETHMLSYQRYRDTVIQLYIIKIHTQAKKNIKHNISKALTYFAILVRWGGWQEDRRGCAGTNVCTWSVFYMSI